MRGEKPGDMEELSSPRPVPPPTTLPPHPHGEEERREGRETEIGNGWKEEDKERPDIERQEEQFEVNTRRRRQLTSQVSRSFRKPHPSGLQDAEHNINSSSKNSKKIQIFEKRKFRKGSNLMIFEKILNIILGLRPKIYDIR